MGFEDGRRMQDMTEATVKDSMGEFSLAISLRRSDVFTLDSMQIPLGLFPYIF